MSGHLGDVDGLGGAVSQQQLGFHVGAVDVVAAGGVVSGDNHGDVLGGSGDVHDLGIEDSGAQGDVLDGVVHVSLGDHAGIGGVAGGSHPGVVDLILGVDVSGSAAADAGNSRGLQLQLLDGVVAVHGVHTVDEADPVAGGKAVIGHQVVQLLSGNARAELHAVLAHVVDLGNGHGGADHGVDLAVAGVVHHLEGVGAQVGAGSVSLQGVQSGGGGIVTEVVHGDGVGVAIQLVVGAGHGHGVSSVVVVLHVAGSALNDHGALVGVHTVDDLVVLGVVDDLDLLAEEAGVVHIGLQRLGAAAILDLVGGVDGAAAEGIAVALELIGPLLLGGVVGEVLQVAQLDDAVKLLAQQGHRIADAIVVLGGPGHIGLGQLAGGQVLAPGALHHGALNGVVSHLAGIIAADGLRGNHVAQVLVQTSLVGVAAHVDGPAVAGEAEHVGVVAHSGQEHLGGLLSSQGAGGVELAGAVAIDDAHAGAVLNVLLGPDALDVGVGGVHLGADNGLDTAVHHVGNDLGHLLTGQGVIGSEIAAVVLAADDVQSHHDFDSLFVLDLTGIGEILGRRAGAHYHHAHQHESSQSQTQRPLEVSHRKFLLLKICP